MQIKLLQLNMWAGTHFPALQEFLEKNRFDILCFQEVCGPQTYVGNIKCTIDCFEKLKTILGPRYEGQLTKASRLTSSPTAYDGNAIFYTKDFVLKKQEVIWLNERTSPFPSDAKSYEDFGRNALAVTLEKEEKIIHIVNGHLPWANTKIEQPHQREKNQKLVEYLSQVAQPWIFTGDCNILPDSPTIHDLEKLGKNLGKEYGVTNTVDPTVHYNWEKMKPGSTIDYIFVSPDIQVENFRLLDMVHMSDHFGLTTTLSF